MWQLQVVLLDMRHNCPSFLNGVCVRRHPSTLRCRLQVFTVKLWVFFLAFYVHLGSLPDATLAASTDMNSRPFPVADASASVWSSERDHFLSCGV